MSKDPSGPSLPEETKNRTPWSRLTEKTLGAVRHVMHKWGMEGYLPVGFSIVFLLCRQISRKEMALRFPQFNRYSQHAGFARKEDQRAY